MNVMCILTDGFEELEAIGVIALLRRANIDIDVYALDASDAQGRFQICLSKLQDLTMANKDAYDVLFLPGGPHYQILEQTPSVIDLIQYFYEQDKLIAAICAAPTILGRMGLLQGRRYTCFTSMDGAFGGTYVDTYCVSDGNLITGRSVAAVIDFALALIEKLKGKDEADTLKKAIYYGMDQ